MHHGIVTRRNSAFTLIELLVCLSIISLLVALLMPALQKARAASRAVTCMSNLRQGMIAFHSYTSDNKQHAPALMRSSTQADAWTRTLEPYIGGRFGEIYMRCPESVSRDSLAHLTNSPEAFTYTVHFSYPVANAKVPFLYTWPAVSVKLSEIEGRTGFIMADGTSFGGFRSPRSYTTDQVVAWATRSWRHIGQTGNFALPDGSVRAVTQDDFFLDATGMLWRNY
jgi:prepilin-type N-terminal cleavage/methylation domain-containing protein